MSVTNKIFKEASAGMIDAAKFGSNIFTAAFQIITYLTISLLIHGKDGSITDAARFELAVFFNINNCFFSLIPCYLFAQWQLPAGVGTL